MRDIENPADSLITRKLIAGVTGDHLTKKTERPDATRDVEIPVRLRKRTFTSREHSGNVPMKRSKVTTRASSTRDRQKVNLMSSNE